MLFRIYSWNTKRKGYKFWLKISRKLLFESKRIGCTKIQVNSTNRRAQFLFLLWYSVKSYQIVPIVFAHSVYVYICYKSSLFFVFFLFINQLCDTFYMNWVIYNNLMDCACYIGAYKYTQILCKEGTFVGV